MRNTEKLDPLFSKDLNSKLKEILISRNNDGSYTLFSKYHIVLSDGLYSVKMLHEIEFQALIFSCLKHAVTWCTLDRRKEHKLSRRVQEIDLLLSSEDVEISILRRRIENTVDPEDRSIFVAKFFNHESKKRALIKELEGYILDSKYWQTKTFEDCDPKILQSKDKYSHTEWKTTL